MDWRKYANEDEKKYLQQLEAAEKKAEKQWCYATTDFYNYAWMQEVIRKYLGEYAGQRFTFIGGYEEAERRCVCFTPPIEDDTMMTPLAILEVTVKTGIGKPLTHRDFLGALMGLGIERSKIGDIIVKSFGAYIVLQQDLAEYVTYHLLEISRYGKVTIQTIEQGQMVAEPQQFKEITGTVSSLRVDAVFALAFGLSRSQLVKLIEQDKARCNGMHVRASDILKEGDIGTLRGFGKMRFEQVNGMTKKDRMHIKIQRYI